MAAAEVTGRKPSRTLRCRGLADHGHAFRHVESELRHTGGVVAGNDVGVAPPDGSARDLPNSDAAGVVSSCDF